MFQWFKDCVRHYKRRRKAEIVKKTFKFMADPGVEDVDALAFKSGFNWAYHSYREEWWTLEQLKARRCAQSNPFSSGVMAFVDAVERYDSATEIR